MDQQEKLTPAEVSLVDVYRDFPAFYQGLSAKDKVIFWLWLKTENVSLFTHLFSPLLGHDAAQEFKIVVPKGANCFTFVRA